MPGVLLGGGLIIVCLAIVGFALPFFQKGEEVVADCVFTLEKQEQKAWSTLLPLLDLDPRDADAQMHYLLDARDPQTNDTLLELPSYAHDYIPCGVPSVITCLATHMIANGTMNITPEAFTLTPTR